MVMLIEYTGQEIYRKEELVWRLEQRFPVNYCGSDNTHLYFRHVNGKATSKMVSRMNDHLHYYFLSQWKVELFDF